ncbi:MAG: DUF1080 domain-containing protein [Gemmatimonadaceae bacterium]|jgi:hypothetical protein|nr:DUF1080 domain-containing protein [Gemmatimonadaceae bacterium]
MRISLLRRTHLHGFTCVLVFLGGTSVSAQARPPIIGRWDLTVQTPDGPRPSWLEVTSSGFSALVGRFVYAFGSARPIASVAFADGAFSFAIPPQWEQGKESFRVDGTLTGDSVRGTFVLPDGQSQSFVGTRAPLMRRERPTVWGAPRALFNGRDLAGWRAGDGESKWRVINGILTNTASGANLISDATFGDFKLHVEFRYPKNGNSGIYLRGRHEVQVEDTGDREPESTYLGGVYGFLVPNQRAGLGAGQWQAYDITLVGRRVTVVLNGKTIIADQTIPGITGGALDSNEGAPGPIYLQGDHTAVEYRKIVITPAR